MRAEEAYVIAKKYTDDSMAGAGAVAGKPCQIQSITEITGGHRVTFLWVDNSGTSHTSTMDVMNGAQGETGATGADGLGIKSVNVDASDHLIITYDDDTTQDAGQIQITAAVDSVNGKTGAVTLDASDVGALADDTPLFSGDYDDLTNKPSLFSGDYDDLSNKPELFSGDYDDLDNKPSIPSKTSELTNDSSFVNTTAMNTAISTSVEEVVEQVYADNGVLGAKNGLDVSNAINDTRFIDSVESDGTLHFKDESTVSWGLTYIAKLSIKNGVRYKLVLDKTLPYGRLGMTTYPTNTPSASETMPLTMITGYFHQFTDTIEFVATADATLYVKFCNDVETSSHTTFTLQMMQILATDTDDIYVPYAMTNRELTEELTVQESAVTDIIEGATVETSYGGNHLIKVGKIVQLDFGLTNVTATQWSDVIGRIPEGYRPKYECFVRDARNNRIFVLRTDGRINCGETLTANPLCIHVTWITS